MSDDTNDIFPTARRSPSQPSDRVLLEFGSFREFIDDYSAYISPQGMFLLDSPSQTGEEVAFEVRLSDDFRLIHGRGRIEWTVSEGSSGHAAGAALRFVDLDEPSRRLVTRLVDNYRSSGGEPFDVDRRPPAAGAEAASPQHAAEPELPPGMPMSASLGTETIALPVSLAGLVEQGGAGDETETADLEPIEPVAPSAPSAPGAEPELELPEPQTEVLFESAREPVQQAAEQPVEPAEPAAATPGGAGFEPAEFEPSELESDAEVGVASSEIEEALPVIPLVEDPLDAVDPDLSVFDLVEEAIGSRPAESGVPDSSAPADDPKLPLELAAEPLPPAEPDAPFVADSDAGVAPVTAPPVEMPDEDLPGDYYKASGRKPGGRTRLWLTLCLLAVLLGAAAWRFKDTLRGYLPPALGGDGVETASVQPGIDDPAEPAGVAITEPAGRGQDAAQDPAAEPAELANPEGPEDLGPVTDATDAADAADAAGAAGGEDAASPDRPAQETASEPDAAATAEPAVRAPSMSEPAAGASVPGGATDDDRRSVGAPTQVSDIVFRAGEGVTEIYIVTDGALARDDFAIVRVADPPARQVIKIFGPGSGYGREALAVGSPEVRRLRTGFHRVEGRGEVHIVADLTGPGVEVLGTDLRGSTLVVTFGSR